MVEFSMVRSDFPSISIFFVHLCSLLEAVGRRCPKVELFVDRNCPFRFALCSLFPLVHHFVGFAPSYVGEVEVRSSELETGLSLFEDCRVLEVTFWSTPYKA